MTNTYWHKQGSEPLFPDLQWSRPENRAHAGKLLIIGGNLHGFSAPAAAYQEAGKAGIGSAKVLLPSALQKTVGRILENGEYAPSTPSGSFNQQALATWLEWSHWADAILLAGDLGRNSETAITIENFVHKTTAPLTLTKDAVDYFTGPAEALLQRPQTTIVLSLAQLQKLSKKLVVHPISFSMGMQQLAEWLHVFTADYQANIVVYHLQHIFVADSGYVSSTKVGDQESWRVRAAAHCAVWWLQNPNKTFEALTTSVHDFTDSPE